ncbi:MAG: SDR family oxidoreductase [Planctomycetaceae bacterium]
MSDSRAILITGVTRGLGRALVDGFVAGGHTVIGCGRTAEAITALRKEYGSPHRLDVLDVADDVAVREWAENVLDSHGAPELLVNNAAIINRNALLWEVPAADFDACVDVNVKGVANVIRHFVPAMIARRRGVIVNLSSGWGRSTAPEVAPYCTTKWAIEGLSQALAQELPAGMAAVALDPGVIDTEMLRSAWSDSAASRPKPAEWAKSAVPFLLSIGPEHNGEPLTVPG